ncbi:MAG TPA: type IX secretion system sortase PorU [Candidatus Acidoferrales bacterium]|nr:type IX secretion system sortase PorU [Candidatus Acidoferrales bacterium]
MKTQIIAYALLASAIAQLSFAQDMRVLSEGAGSTLIEVTPDLFGADTIKQGGVSYLKLLFDHAVPEVSSSGYLKTFIPVMVGVFSRQINVRIVQTDYSTRSMMRPVRSSGLPSARALFAASEFVSYDAPSEQRRHLVSMIRVYPFLYDSLTGSYKVLKRVVFQVASTGSGITAQAVGTDRLLLESLVNYSQVRNAIVKGSVRNQFQKIQTSSVLAQGPWYSLSISQSGIYRLTYQNLRDAKIPVDSIHLNTIRIFNDGGDALPEPPDSPRPADIMENAIYVFNGNSDGTDNFEPADYILFYGKSPREWTYDPSAHTYHHYLNYYTETNYYFMTYGGQAGKRMQIAPSYHSSSYYMPQDFTSMVAADSELYNLQGSGKDWYGAILEKSTQDNAGVNTVEYLNKLYGLDPTQPITYRLSFASRSDEANWFTIYENSTGTQLGTINGGVVDITGPYSDQGPYAIAVSTPDYTGTGNLLNDMSALKIVYDSDSQLAKGYVDWFEIFYKRRFQALNDALNFYAPDTNAAVYYSVQGFSSNNVRVFDVTDFANVSMVQPDSISGETASFGIQTAAGASKRFYAVGENGFLTAGGISQIQNSDLRGQVSGTDLIIITPPDFLSQANQLANFKQSFDGLKTIVVKTTDIYNEFACGIPDPTAIRDYLNFVYSNDQQIPSYVILFGAGTYDYKNKVASLPEYVPAYESDNSLDQVDSYATDDYFVDFKGSLTSSRISMSLGRLPARSEQDANAIVSKIQQYEQNPNYGSWRNLVTFVGDDHDNNTADSVITDFMIDSEDLANNLTYTPPDLDRRKIYLISYPTIVSTQGIRKPDAAADLVNQINEGTLVVNFVGHGAPDVWSYTHIFENDVTIPQLNNLTTLALFVTATCDFGRDDDPATQSGAELLLNSQKGGAIGAVSSTRVTFENLNSDLNSDLFEHLFTRDSLRNAARIGDAFFATKQDYYSDPNDIKYNYIGDPTVRLALPKYQAAVDSLNGKSLTVQTQQIRALDKLDIKGTVYHPDKTVWNDFNGTALLTIYDSDKNIHIPQLSYTYRTQGSILFRGEISIKDGTFDAKAVIPKDISYSNITGKIELYFQANGSDGIGYTRNVVVGGTDTNAVNDHKAPTVKIYLDSRNFRDGDVVSEKPNLIVDLHSDNGINLSDAGVGHNLQATFDGQQSVDLGPYYVGAVDSYQDGTVNFPVTMALSTGKHSVEVDAFDVFNNSAEASAAFDLESSQQLSLMNVYNYPDPFRDATAFTFQRTAVGGPGEPVNVKIKVFTLSGRLIKTIQAYGLTDTFVKIDWNGLDDDGNRLANGVYLYKVIVSTVDGSQTSEAIGKMAVLR